MKVRDPQQLAHGLGAVPPPKRVKHRRWAKSLLIAFLSLAALLAIARAMLPWAVRNYVNRTLSTNPLYSGSIGDVQIHLWRGAYTIESIRLDKTTGNVPVPFFSARKVDLAIQWKALFHGRIVGRVRVENPELNFVDSPSDADSQTGGGGAWLSMIQNLFPFLINSFMVENGSVHFRTYQTEKPVDVYLSHLSASIDNLGNISDQSTPLSASVQVAATAMDEAKLELKMTLDPSSYDPTFHLALRLLNLDVTKINDLALAYGKFDFKRGWFDLVLEADAKQGQLSGYIKPLFRDLKIFSLRQDLKQDNVLEFFWQSLLGATTTILRNQPRSQFGTLIPFSGQASGPTTVAILPTIGNLFRNAFIRAYLPQRESNAGEGDDLHFDPPDFINAISTSNGDQ